MTKNDLIKSLYTKDGFYVELDKVLEFIGLCHSVIVEPGEPKKLSASSPEESALLESIAELGYDFVKKDRDNNLILQCLDEPTTRQF